MKKTFTLLALVLTVGAVIGFTAPKVIASTTGWLYGHGLIIDSVPGTTVAAIKADGVLTIGSFTSVQLTAKTPAAAGEIVYNSTNVNLCVSTGATAGAYITLASTSAARNYVACD